MGGIILRPQGKKADPKEKCAFYRHTLIEKLEMKN
jgi:hypothetical protein